MDLHYLELFTALASELNYTRAAEKLHISQPALSMQIKKLEKQLNTTLFDRVGNKTILNENGQLLYSCTRKVFDLLNETEQIMKNKRITIEGNISVGGSNTSGTYLLPRIIGSFLLKHPNVKVNLHIGNTDEISRLVTVSDIDFGVNGGSLVYPDYIHVEHMMDDNIVLVASPNSTLPDVIEDTMLLNDACFVSHEPNSQLYKVVQQVIVDLQLQTGISMSFGSIDAIKQAVAANLGISAIPLSAAETELKYHLVREITVKDRQWKYPYSLIYNKNRYISPASKALMQHIRVELEKVKAKR